MGYCKSCTLKEINSYKYLYLEKKKISNQKEKTQITKINNERTDIATDITEIKRIIRAQHKQLHTNKLNEIKILLKR